MKKTTLLLALLLTSILGADKNTTLNKQQVDRPSRLAEGYGTNQLLSDNLPYMPDMKIENSIKFVGDIRLRSQTIKDEESTQSKFRYRVRAGFQAKVNDNTKIEFMLATGEGDPVSTNQDFGNGFSGANVIIDIADIYYEYGYHSFIRAGKMKLPFYRVQKNQMLWDNDLRPEGIFTKYKLLQNTDITVGAFIVRGDAQTPKQNDTNTTLSNPEGDSVYLYTTQVVQHLGYFRVGASANVYSSLKGESPYVMYNSGKYSEGGSANDGQGKNLSKGNSLDANGNYLYDYYLAEVFAKYKITDSLAVGIDYIYNFAIKENNHAFNISLMYGKLKKNGDYKLGYYYRDTQKDAVLGAYSDSDFAGGYTDSKGHQLMAGYQLAKNTQLAVTYIYSTKYVSTPIPENFQCLHLDLKFKF